MIPRRNLIRALKKSIKQPGYAVQNLTKRLKAHVAYAFGKGRSSWPETLSLFITYRCNLKCKMCGQWGDQGIFKNYNKNVLSHQLSTDTIRRLIVDVKPFKPNITLFGGEPLIDPNIMTIIRVIKANGLRCNLITNGTLLEKYAAEILNSGLDEIIFSLDGPSEIHDSIRGIPGAYARALKGFDLLNKLKKQNTSNKPFININSTIFEDNYGNLQETIEAAREFQPDNLTFHHLLFLDNNRIPVFQKKFQEQFGQIPYDWNGFGVDQIPNIDPMAIISQIKNIKAIKHPFNVGFYPNLNNDDIKKWYTSFEFKSNSYRNRCLSLWMTAYIFPDGTVRPYHTMNYDIGNINNESFLTIWNNNKFQKLRRHIIKHKSFEVCSKGCTEFFRY